MRNFYSVLGAAFERQSFGAFHGRRTSMDSLSFRLGAFVKMYLRYSYEYIVLLDKTYPIATCRFYELDEHSVLLGRVVVLPDYRDNHLGSKIIEEAEKWIAELGYKEIFIDSRVDVVGFYEKLGYTLLDGTVVKSWKFDCKRMCKSIK